jgi:hypothetical protein
MNHSRRSHEIAVPLPVDTTFALFTPRGEMRWIADWKPDFIHPADGEICEGMVFRTGAGAEETFWSCVEWRPDLHRVRYARVTPASRFAHVTVQCTPIDSNSTRVEVGYALTALNEAGVAMLAAQTEEAFSASIETWKVLIETHIVAAGG